MTTIPELTPYQIKSLDAFYLKNDVSGQTILEIGGLYLSNVAPDLESNGATVTTVALDASFATPPSAGTSVTTLTGSVFPFADNTFDSVIAIGMIERTHNLTVVLDEVYRVLKPNGMCYIDGGPLWSSRIGAHYAFTHNGIYYHKGTNPILLDWEHLYSSKEEIRTRLLNLYPVEVIDTVLHRTYDHTRLNRKFPSEILSEVNNSLFTVKEHQLDTWSEIPMPAAIRETVQSLHPAFDDPYDYLTFFLTK